MTVRDAAVMDAFDHVFGMLHVNRHVSFAFPDSMG